MPDRRQTAAGLLQQRLSGLAAHPALKEAVAASALRWGTGSGGSHVVSGYMQPHEALEKALAAFVGAERALFYSTGYMANIGVVPTLVGRGTPFSPTGSITLR